VATEHSGPVRSVFLQWPILVRERERVLDDLSAWTQINTIEISHFYLGDWGTRGRGGGAEPAPLVVPPEADFDGLTVPVTDGRLFETLRASVEHIRAKGFRVAINVCPLYVAPPELDALACVDVTGARVPGHNPEVAIDACPSNPATVRYAEALVRAFVRFLPLDAVTVNHVEYALWPETGFSGLFACFCAACRERAGSIGLDLAAVQAEVLAAYRRLTSAAPRASDAGVRPTDVLNVLIDQPRIADWLSFRMRSMTDLATRTIRAVRSSAPGLPVGLEFQLPALSRLVGTDFLTLAPLCDWATPKFPDYLTASTIPFVADEIAARSGGWAVEDLRRLVRELLDLGPGPAEYVPRSDPIDGVNFADTFDASIVDRQMRYLALLPGEVVLYPYLWHYDDVELLEAKVDALHRNGLNGFFLWCGERDLSTDALRATSGIL
jgi:hypothetical protein